MITLQVLSSMIKYSKDKAGLEKYLNKDCGLIVDVKTAKAINDLTQLGLRIPEGKEEINMCKAMEELIKDGEARGEARGAARGEARGMLKTLTGLVMDGMISIKDAAPRAGMTEDRFREEMERFSKSDNLGNMNLF